MTQIVEVENTFPVYNWETGEVTSEIPYTSAVLVGDDDEYGINAEVQKMTLKDTGEVFYSAADSLAEIQERIDRIAGQGFSAEHILKMVESLAHKKVCETVDGCYVPEILGLLKTHSGLLPEDVPNLASLARKQMEGYKINDAGDAARKLNFEIYKASKFTMPVGDIYFKFFRRVRDN